jgi:hypothetical protein
VRQEERERALRAMGPVVRASLGVACTALALAGTLGTVARAALPDGRVYEAVSPVAEEGSAQAYVPAAGAGYLTSAGEHGIFTSRPFEVAPNGEAVAYPGDPPPTGGGGHSGVSNGDEWLSRRSPGGGWKAVDLQPTPGLLEAPFLAFSEDLSTAILSSSQPIVGSAPPGGFYSYATEGASGEYLPFFTGPSPGEVFFAGGNAGEHGTPAFSHLLFQSTAVIAGEGALERELRESVEKSAEPNILYEAVDGHLNIVNVLPDGKADAETSFGSFPASTAAPGAAGLDGVISANASRVFWTDANTEVSAENPSGQTRLFVREDNGSAHAATVQVDAAEQGCGSCAEGGGVYWAASSNGSKVFFTDTSRLTSDSTAGPEEPDLYEYEVNPEVGAPGRITDLTALQGGAHADIKGVVGASTSGSYVYFVGGGVLTDEKNANGEQATPGTCQPVESAGPERQEEMLGHIPPGSACNLLVLHAGEAVRFIASLPPADDGGSGPSGVVPFDGANGAEQEFGGDWQASAGYRTAQITPDGGSLVFMSNRSLTHYDSEVTAGGQASALDEVFLYEAGSGVLRCVSCDPSDAPPAPTEFDSYHGPIGGFVPITKVASYRAQPRVVADDGSRVFFDSGEPLVAQDASKWLGVYEWERDATGSCEQAQGCVYLISSSEDPESSYLLGASASGNDVFFLTRAQLLPQDGNDNFDVYDARVEGVLAPTPSGCGAGGCASPAPPAPSPLVAPEDSAPASFTFSGPGDLSSPLPPPAKKVMKLTRAQQLARALKACGSKRDRRKRAACEAQARHRYGAPKPKASRARRPRAGGDR